MNITYSASVGFIQDFECELDISVEWESGFPALTVNDVLVDGHSLLRHDDKLMSDFGYRIADQAEDDDWLIETAIGREAA